MAAYPIVSSGHFEAVKSPISSGLVDHPRLVDLFQWTMGARCY
ncbi:MAG: hypothetical protein ACTSWN_06135 [Promethearchaeota archaeon]